MKTRIITATVLFVVIIPFFIFFHTPAGAVLMAILGLLSVYELSSVGKIKDKWPVLIPFYLAAVGVPLIV